MDIRLTPDIEAALIIEARESGSTPEAVALDILRERLDGATRTIPAGQATNLEEFLREYIGVLPTDAIEGQTSHSEATGEAFTRLLREKYERGSE